VFEWIAIAMLGIKERAFPDGLQVYKRTEQ